MSTPIIVRSLMNEDWPCGHKRFLDLDWLHYRMQIYFYYTVPSLLQQTDRDFQIWLDCRPGSEADLEPYLPVLEEVGVLATFDRGRVFLTRLQVPEILLLRIDSDDCYMAGAVEAVRRLPDDQKGILFTHGWLWLEASQILYQMQYHSPPFYALRIALDDNGMIWPPHAGHNAVRGVFRPQIVADRAYCMVRHGKHSGDNPLVRPERCAQAPKGSVPYEAVTGALLLHDARPFWERRQCSKVLDLLSQPTRG